MTQVFITLGSNIEPEKHIREAIERLGKAVSIVAVGQVYLSGAMDIDGNVNSNQPYFLNTAVLVETDIPPVDLKFEVLRRIEAEMGRRRTEDKYTARMIDLDIALCGTQVINSDRITVPDPDILRFPHVAYPLRDLAPDFNHPLANRSLARIADELSQTSKTQIEVVDIDP